MFGTLFGAARHGKPRGGAGAEPWNAPFAPVADENDIYYCFRLLLGRRPNREEWPGHRSIGVGKNLTDVVASYAQSLEFSRRGLTRRERAGAAILTELPDFRVYTDESDVAVGLHVRAGQYEPDVTSVFRRLLRPGMGVIDIGANLGYCSLLSASIVGPGGYVLAVEPNAANVRLLEASRRANGFAQVTICQAGAGAETGLLALHTSHSNGTTSPPSEDLEALLEAELVPCIRPDALVPPQRRIDLIKADVEGAEYLALRGCSAILERDRPVIVSEFSPGMLPGISGVTGEAYLAWLAGHDYALHVVEPDGSLKPGGASGAAVMAKYHARGTDHVDIVALPA